MPTRRFERGRQDHPKVCEGCEAHPVVREELGDPPKGSGVVGRPNRWFERGQEAHVDIREGSNVWEAHP